MSAVKVWVTVEVRGERTCVVELDGPDFTDADLLEEFCELLLQTDRRD